MRADPAPPQKGLTDADTRKALAVTAEVGKAVLGKPEAILKIMMAMLARGHVLVEDIPGVGKTTLAQAFARAMQLTQNRVQFTPDVLPSDIVGFSLYQKETGKFVLPPRRGGLQPVFGR